MSGSDRDWDLLLHRYLEGTLGPEEASILNARLKEDRGLAQRLAEMSVDAVQLKDLDGEVDEPISETVIPSVPRRSWPKGSIAAAAAILVAVIVAIVARSFQAGSVDVPVPAASIEGFAGRVGGTIVRADEGPVGLRVEEVFGDDDTVRDLLVGRTIRLQPDRAWGTRADWRVEQQRSFLLKLRSGDEVVLEVAHAEDDEFKIVRLTRVQAEWAGGERERRDGERARDPDRQSRGRGETRRRGDRDEEGREERRREGDREEGGRRESGRNEGGERKERED